MMTSFSLDPWRQSKTYITPKNKAKATLEKSKAHCLLLKKYHTNCPNGLP